jgi:TolB protein
MHAYRTPLALATFLSLFVACPAPSPTTPAPSIETPAVDTASSLQDPRETFFTNLRQLTFSGENAEAYFSFDGTRLVFQSTSDGFTCDQIFTMNLDGSDRRLISSGKGRCTCSYFMPGDKELIYASTHLGGDACPPPPDRSQGYVWPIYPEYDLFVANLDGSNVRQLTEVPGYDAEATVSPDGKKIVFTSMRHGDLEIYSMNIDGSDVQRLTEERGYDGGAFYSPDSKLICYRASHPTEQTAVDRYTRLLGQGLIEPRALDLYVMNADGSNKRQITRNGKANFCPYFTPDGKFLVFSSNLGDEKGREFDMYLVSLEGGDPIRVTYTAEFDGFPMFSPDGKKLVFCSNRGAKQRGETNVFIADWVGPR